MRNRRWMLTIFLLVVAMLSFVYVKGQVIPEKSVLDASKQNVKATAFNDYLFNEWSLNAVFLGDYDMDADGLVEGNEMLPLPRQGVRLDRGQLLHEEASQARTEGG